MGYTNKTSHYDLPQWIAGDKPSWLGDVNTAMLNIDTAIAGADASASAAESSAAAANAQVQAQEAKITKNTTDIQALTENLADTQGEVNNVKTIAEDALPKSGGTMTGNLILNAAPTSDLQAATKKYVDDNSGKGALMLSGGTMTGPLTLSGAPTTDLMAATKKYVDDKISTKTTAAITRNSGNTDGTKGFKGNVIATNSLATISMACVLSSNVTGVLFTTNSYFAEFFTCSGNPLGLTVKQISGITADDELPVIFPGLAGSTYFPVTLFAYYDGTTTHFGAVGTSASFSSYNGLSLTGCYTWVK